MSESYPSFHTILEATGGNNVGLVVPDNVVTAFGRGEVWLRSLALCRGGAGRSTVFPLSWMPQQPCLTM